jgi:hypothetical protein
MTLSSENLPTGPDVPQVLLFGHSGSGKSALLGALLQAGELQGAVLQARVFDPSGRLQSIRDALSDGISLDKTTTEVTRYSVQLRPLDDKAGQAEHTASFILTDCSGRAAESLIHHPYALLEQGTHGPVARAVIEADAIVLLVDASADAEELYAAFEDFDAFLHVVWRGKEGAREVGGFPVLLVLTQCDKLAEPTDTRAKWEERIQRRTDRAWKEFDKFLKDAAPEDGVPSPFLPFGSIDLTVYAVAVRVPRTLDRPGERDTPYGVAEMFRDCFTEAAAHRSRVVRSNQRLAWTVRGTLAFVTLLVAAAVGVTFFQPARPDTGLEDRVVAYQTHEAPPPVRLSEQLIAGNKQTLAAFRDDPRFSQLPPDLQEYVNSRVKEIEDYENYWSRLMHASSPGEARSEDELNRVDLALRSGDLALPAGYDWEQTAAGQLQEKWAKDVAAIRETEKKFFDRYIDLYRRGTVLALASSFGGNWRAEVNSLLEEGSRLPAVLGAPLPGSAAVATPRGQPVANRVPFEFDRVYQARKDWDLAAEKLAHLRDLADALALTAGPGRPEPVLFIPEPGPAVNSVRLPLDRLISLPQQYPREAAEPREWEVRNFSDPGRKILSDRLEQSFRNGVRQVQALLLARLGNDGNAEERAESLRKLAVTLVDPVTPFPEWGRLLHFIARLRDPAATNPVLDLAVFLARTSFDLDFRGFELTIPDDLALEKVVPSGPLTITVASPSQSVQVQRFKLQGGGVREGSATTYRFMPEEAARLVYHPGDGFQAELPVQSGSNSLRLVWSSGGSRAYQFDRLEREPRLVRSPESSEPAVGVKLTAARGSIVPRLPTLFPEPRP